MATEFEDLVYHGDVLLTMMRDEIKLPPGGQAAWAKIVGLSPTYVSSILRGRTEISDRVAHIMGFRRVPAFTYLARTAVETREPLAPEITGPWISEALAAAIEEEVA